MDANSGYCGFSMSKRAVEAYENGEKPKSRWTKSAMLLEIGSYLNDLGVELPDDALTYLKRLTKAEMFDRFFSYSSWHHTSKHFNVTDFYALDESAVDAYVIHPTRRVYGISYTLGRHSKECRETFNTKAGAKRYLGEHGFKSYGYLFMRGGFTASIMFTEAGV